MSVYKSIWSVSQLKSVFFFSLATHPLVKCNADPPMDYFT